MSLFLLHVYYSFWGTACSIDGDLLPELEYDIVQWVFFHVQSTDNKYCVCVTSKWDIYICIRSASSSESRPPFFCGSPERTNHTLALDWVTVVLWRAWPHCETPPNPAHCTFKMKNRSHKRLSWETCWREVLEKQSLVSEIKYLYLFIDDTFELKHSTEMSNIVTYRGVPPGDIWTFKLNKNSILWGFFRLFFFLRLSSLSGHFYYR